MSETREPWDRQDGESSMWFARFDNYRRMGPKRSILAVLHAEDAQRGFERKRASSYPASWHEASVRWRWRERADLWDRAQQRLLREAEDRDLAERRRAWIAQAQALQAVGSQALLRLQDLVAEGVPGVLSPRDTLAFLGEGLKLELLARGEPTEIAERRHRDLPVEEMSDDELRRIAATGSPGDPPPPGRPEEPPGVHDVHEA